MINKLFLCGGLALLAAFGGGVNAQEPAKPGDSGAAEAQESRARHLTGGEITTLSEDSFQIRPWNVKLPRRLQVTATGATLYYHQKSGSVKDVKAGDFVLLVHEKPDPNKSEPDSTAESAPAKPRRPAIRAVLRLPEPPGAAVSDAFRERARGLLHAARPFFKGKRRGGAAKPQLHAGTKLGTVASIEPFVLTAADGPHPFRLKDETLVINHLKIGPGDLKKGHSVNVQSESKPGADGTLQAALVAVSPQPRLNPRWERKLLLREKGRKAEN